MWGGMISIIDDGQKGEGTQYVNKSGKNSTEEIQAESNEKKGLTPKAILDGIQLTLDIAGLAPGVGAIADLTNAAIYAFRGDMVNAGLSLFAAVPGAGDAATATKLVGKGLKAAKAAGKTTEVVSKTVKTADKAASTVYNAEKTAAKVGQKPFGELTKRSSVPNSNTGQKVPFGELTQKQSATNTNMVPGQKPFGELTQKPSVQNTNMVPDNKVSFGELTQKSQVQNSDLVPGQKYSFGELTQQAHTSGEIPVGKGDGIIEQASKTVSDSKPINANTVEELEHTKEVLKADELSRKPYGRKLDVEG
jgi:hypothetical protein